MSISTGVCPVYENAFKFSIVGTSGTASDMKSVADMDNFSLSIDGNVEEWKPLEQQGWTRNQLTGKGMTITITGKRNVGDDGNDYIAGLATKTGQDCATKFEWTFPDGSTLTGNCTINVTNINLGGESTAMAPLEFEVRVDGKPTFTAAS